MIGPPRLAKDIIRIYKPLSKKRLELRVPKYDNENYCFDDFDLFVSKLDATRKKYELEKGLKSLIAAEFWERNFPGQTEVPFKDFEEKFMWMTRWMHKITIREKEIEKLKETLGDNIRRKQFDDLIWSIWNVYFKRDKFLDMNIIYVLV